AVNTSFVTVTVCMPGGTFTQCQDIDHIEVDTGSSGLRIIAGPPTSAAGGELTLALPAVADPNTAGNVLGECLQFADGSSWGSVNTADIKMKVSGETATNVVVHIIGATSTGDPAKASPSCVPMAPLLPENTVPTFGANGILGVGPFLNDCATNTDCPPGNSATYYTCTKAPSCTSITATSSQQVPNPAALFGKDNNGVIIELPAVGATGHTAPLQGTLVFGIGTETNNALGSATQLPACPGNSTQGICGLNGVPLAGTIEATLNGSVYQESYLDSGSNANFFPSSSVPECAPVGSGKPNAGFYCPQSGTTVAENATLTGSNGTMLAADFTVANANDLFNTNCPQPGAATCGAAFSNLAGDNSSTNGNPNETVDLGLSFFFGRNVFTGFEDPATSAPPYFAY
ncbi:MAG: DUF3443 family protein, partial [Gammaproteobacteria bacterium]|nr:DUF3443 family protein [Gammaproteobacteria bacterium]